MGTFLSERTSRTRKPRKCAGCLLTWPSGTTFRHCSYIDDGGDFGSSATCPVCEAILGEWDRRDREDGYTEGELRDNNEAYWDEVREKLGLMMPEGVTQ